MKKTNKILALGMAAVLTLSMTACSSNGSNSNNTSANNNQSNTEAAANSDAKYVVGICQLVQHDALDAATKGFKDSLTKELGSDVTFDEQNASGDTPTCSTIVNTFVSKKVDLILANATAPLQAAAAATTDIPILGTSVTDYATALNISDWTGLTGRNISGTSDLAPLSEQANMLHELFPDAKNVGLIYCSAEANSEYQVSVITKELEKFNYTCTPYSFVDSNDIASIVQNAVDASDVLYVPTDNTAANNTEVINNIASEAGVPIIAGEEGICKGCGVATLSISYYDLGYQTGEMAAAILTGSKDVSEMEIQYAPAVTKKYNPDLCEKLNITVPDDYEAIDMSAE